MSDYEHGHARLDHAVTEVQAFAGLLEGGFERTVLANPGEGQARDGLRELRGSMAAGSCLVVLWSGHGQASAGGLRLLACDSRKFESDGLAAAGDVVLPAAESGATQILFIIDTCFSGDVLAAAGIAAGLLQRTAAEGERIWAGVLSSCLPAETARDGLFGRRLRRLLETGR